MTEYGKDLEDVISVEDLRAALSKQAKRNIPMTEIATIYAGMAERVDANKDGNITVGEMAEFMKAKAAEKAA